MAVKRSTAIGRLVRFAEEATAELSRPYPGDYPVVSAWAIGDLLDPATATLQVPLAVLVIDVPPAEAAWLSRPSVVPRLNVAHRLDKGGFYVYYRPAAWPAWNVEYRRVSCFWTRTDGLNEQLIEDLRASRSIRAVEPTEVEFATQMRTELVVSRTHLDDVLGSYYERDWRDDHKGGYYLNPEDHLWWAAAGYRAIEQAVSSLS